MKSACSSNVFKHGAVYGSQIGAEKAKLKLRELKELTESHHAKSSVCRKRRLQEIRLPDPVH